MLTRQDFAWVADQLDRCIASVQKGESLDRFFEFAERKPGGELLDDEGNPIKTPLLVPARDIFKALELISDIAIEALESAPSRSPLKRWKKCNAQIMALKQAKQPRHEMQALNEHMEKALREMSLVWDETGPGLLPPLGLAELLEPEPEPKHPPPLVSPALAVPVVAMVLVAAIILLGWSPFFLVPIAGGVSAALVLHFRREAFQRRMSSLFAHLAAGSALVPTVSLVVEDSRLLISGASALVTMSLVAASCVFGWQEHRQFMKERR